jgi:hypothetical protein
MLLAKINEPSLPTDGSITAHREMTEEYHLETPAIMTVVLTPVPSYLRQAKA